MTDVIVNIVIVLVITILSIIVIYLTGKAKHEHMDKMSFREAIDLCNLPVVTFVNNDKKLNFILDTGAEKSAINKSVLEDLKYNTTNERIEVYGIEGNKQLVDFIEMSIDYKFKSYSEKFQVMNLSSAFEALKLQYGVNVHGILSSTFFKRYKYTLDFDELIAYSKL